MSPDLRHSKAKVVNNEMRYTQNLKFKKRYSVMQIKLTNNDLEENPDDDS